MMRATIRSAALREMLVEHQRRIQDDVYAVLRDSRASLASAVGHSEVWGQCCRCVPRAGPASTTHCAGSMPAVTGFV
jgi:hypothetical protein